MSGGSLVVENDPFTRLIPISEIIRTKEQIVDTLGKLSCCGFNGVLLTLCAIRFARTKRILYWLKPVCAVDPLGLKKPDVRPCCGCSKQADPRSTDRA